MLNPLLSDLQSPILTLNQEGTFKNGQTMLYTVPITHVRLFLRLEENLTLAV